MELPEPKIGLVVTVLLISGDVEKSRDFYTNVLGAELIESGRPTFLKFANTWIIINDGGGPTDDKPDVYAKPPHDPNILSIALNLRVADIESLYTTWKSRGAQFLTEPKVHEDEIRCYMRDPDGYLIEVGQSR
jgi:catechol 2,3-dioxygenase-like lactoylglutathione lyase family enzyme